MNFRYGKTRLWRLLKKMGFGYEKRGRQRIISERPEIIAWRERYLRRIRKIREADPERANLYGRDMAESGTSYKERMGRP